MITGITNNPTITKTIPIVPIIITNLFYLINLNISRIIIVVNSKLASANILTLVTININIDINYYVR